MVYWPPVSIQLLNTKNRKLLNFSAYYFPLEIFGECDGIPINWEELCSILPSGIRAGRR
jgi:hypothetical protein